MLGSLFSFLSGKKTNIVGGAMVMKVVGTAAVAYLTGGSSLIEAAQYIYANSDPALTGMIAMSLRAAISKAASKIGA